MLRLKEILKEKKKSEQELASKKLSYACTPFSCQFVTQLGYGYS